MCSFGRRSAPTLYPKEILKSRNYSFCAKSCDKNFITQIPHPNPPQKGTVRRCGTFTPLPFGEGLGVGFSQLFAQKEII